MRGSTRTQHRRPGTRQASSRPPRRGRETSDRPEDLAAPVPVAQETGSGSEAAPVERHAASARPTPQARQRVKPGSLLAARAATEYVYVTQDLKRITLVGGLIFATLIGLWLLIVVMRVIPLPFY